MLSNSLTLAAPAAERDLTQRDDAGKLVFAHFMMGIIADRTGAADYDADMKGAKSAGINAFALNVGTDSYTETQLEYAYESAAKNDMKVFISFDFNWYDPASSASAVGGLIAKFAGEKAQLKYDNKVFASSFTGDGFDVAAMKTAAGVPVFWAPNIHPGQGDFSEVDGALNWIAWPNDGNNKAPTAANNVSVAVGDTSYKTALGNKALIAPVSPWFFTHYGPEVSYSKNWVFSNDLLWFNRWNEILTLGPQFVEIITWNDYGESHYIGPLASKHHDDGNSKWVNDMPHNGWLDMAKPYIAAYKAGAMSPDAYIKEDKLVYWYRPTLKSINCDSTDTTMASANDNTGNYFQGRPDGSASMADAVFVVAMLKEAGTVTVTSGKKTQKFNAPAGATAFQAEMQVGKQSFSLERGGKSVISGTSLRDISDVCPCGLYNFNAFVGTVPDGTPDSLGADGLSSLTVGLKAACEAKPSLAAGIGPVPTTDIITPVSSAVKDTVVPTAAASLVTPPKSAATPPKSSNPPPSEPTLPSSSTCIAGTGPSNLLGLCTFACNLGFCPAPCDCSAQGTAIVGPSVSGKGGRPVSGNDSGLCDFTCKRDYCPETACVSV
ncbi:putative alpha-1,3-glucanase/mutanase [Amylocarpus encephaloides]|uniref:Alpha-1,3-glucanase/mutanase n=1 Tax=Amylocarpus encephaloides TaxID=45428 RepID=A0A9P7YTN0_9HELO|nr:putative alpha-1,3-glucanase/mutanase [Amylocarpus encephaloides]